MPDPKTIALEYLDPSLEGTLKRQDALSVFMDTAFRIPGTQMRVGVDAILSFMPVAGSLAGPAFDLFFKANSRNLAILRNHLEETLPRERSSGL